MTSKKGRANRQAIGAAFSAALSFGYGAYRANASECVATVSEDGTSIICSGDGTEVLEADLSFDDVFRAEIQTGFELNGSIVIDATEANYVEYTGVRALTVDHGGIVRSDAASGSVVTLGGSEIVRIEVTGEVSGGNILLQANTDYLGYVTISEGAILNSFGAESTGVYDGNRSGNYAIFAPDGNSEILIEDSSNLAGGILSSRLITVNDDALNNVVLVGGRGGAGLGISSESLTLTDSEVNGNFYLSGGDGALLTISDTSRIRLAENRDINPDPAVEEFLVAEFDDTVSAFLDVQLDGEFLGDLNLSTLEADTISVTGELTGSGEITVYAHSLPAASGEIVIASATDGVSGDFTLNVIGGDGAEFTLLNSGDELILNVQTAVANQSQLNAGQFLNFLDDNAGDGDADTIAAAINGAADQQAAALAFTGTGHAATVETASNAGLGFGRGLFSCAVGEGTYAAIDEGRCGSTRIEGQFFERDEVVGAAGASQTLFGFTAGYQAPLDDHLRLGFGGGVDRLTGSSTDNSDSDGVGMRLGAALKYVDGPMMFGGSLSFGAMDVDTTRDTGVGVANGSFKTVGVAAIARAAALVTFGDNLYLKPQIEGGLSHVYRSGFDENGAGGGEPSGRIGQ